jgi:peptide/nickel transport system substrate-binding protein
VELLRSVDRDDADWRWMFAGVYNTPGLDFEAKYGLCKLRFCVKPGLTLRLLAFNASRPLFGKNPRLRRAVNLALDRHALVESSYGPRLTHATDQLVPPGVPGFRDADVYPLEGDLERARELADGQLRTAKAVLSVSGQPEVIETAQLVTQQLAKIGLEVEIVEHPGVDFGADLLASLTRPGADWDIAFLIWEPSIPDAHEHLSRLLETRLQGGETLTRVHSKRASEALARAARLPPGRARNLALAEVDRMITRDVAPVAVLSVYNEVTIVSERVDPDCMVLRPALDLAVACLRD